MADGIWFVPIKPIRFDSLEEMELWAKRNQEKAMVKSTISHAEHWVEEGNFDEAKRSLDIIKEEALKEDIDLLEKVAKIRKQISKSN